MIHIGTSGYSFRDWKGNFYPDDISNNQMLEYYAQFFKVVEINSTYYGIPKPESFARMAGKTPKDFLFTVKANKNMTHEREDNKSVFDEFEKAINPLIEAKKFGGLLLQFPWSFKNTENNRRYLSNCKDRLTNYPLIVEFRHNSWISEPIFDFLKSLDMSYCAVDEPDLPGLIPPELAVTSSIGYVRFHGRNAEKWWEGDSSERYNYLYSEEEIQQWVPKIKELAVSTRDTYLMFNNCHAGHAAKNAKDMQDILQPDLFQS
ncbi:DUF72 domain-containing protein [Candidatus Poribacteria bacterium]|nr:DUF72 domain-containing protein [Candidatus Poribacteria bacterium]